MGHGTAANAAHAFAVHARPTDGLGQRCRSALDRATCCRSPWTPAHALHANEGTAPGHAHRLLRPKTARIPLVQCGHARPVRTRMPPAAQSTHWLSSVPAQQRHAYTPRTRALPPRRPPRRLPDDVETTSSSPPTHHHVPPLVHPHRPWHSPPARTCARRAVQYPRTCQTPNPVPLTFLKKQYKSVPTLPSTGLGNTCTLHASRLQHEIIHGVHVCDMHTEHALHPVRARHVPPCRSWLSNPAYPKRRARSGMPQFASDQRTSPLCNTSAICAVRAVRVIRAIRVVRVIHLASLDNPVSIPRRPVMSAHAR